MDNGYSRRDNRADRHPDGPGIVQIKHIQPAPPRRREPKRSIGRAISSIATGIILALCIFLIGWSTLGTIKAWRACSPHCIEFSK